MNNVPECFTGINVVDICAGNKSKECEKCVFIQRVTFEENDAGGYREFFGDLSTMSGIGIEIRQQDIIAI